MLVLSRPFVDIRSALAERFPSHLAQQALTAFTGKALPGQRPLFRYTPWTRLMGALAGLLGGSAASSVLLHHGGLWLILLPWTLLYTAGSSRVLMITVLHHLVHGNFSGSEIVDRIVFEIVAIPLLLMDFDTYYSRHVSGHHGAKVATREDPEAYGMVIGFLPGMPRAALWRRFWMTVASPVFHARILAERALDCFVRTSAWRRITAVAFHLGVLAVVAFHHAWQAWAVAWLLPITVLFNLGALLQFSTEHRWYLQTGGSRRQRLARLTFGRFVGEAPPPAGAAKEAWAAFWLRMLLVHLPVRMLVWVADMPHHDAHHRHPTRFDWANPEYARQADVEAGCPGWPEAYTEVWGLGPALDECFSAIAASR